MRAGFAAPIETLLADDLDRLRAYFDGQSRIHLVVWVSHDEPGNDGLPPDHHIVLGMDDQDYANGDPEAVLRGVEDEAWLPGWVDVFPLSEVETLRSFGMIVWERGPGAAGVLDPLDFRLTWDPVDVPQDRRVALGDLLEAIPAATRVEATHERLWKADIVVYEGMRLFVGYDLDRGPIHDLLARVGDAWRRSNMPGGPNPGSSLGLPGDSRVKTGVLYESRAGGGRT